MTIFWQITFQVILLALIFGITDFHYHWFLANKKTGTWFHFLWGCAYFIPAFFIGWSIYQDWKVLVLLTAERFVFYNPMLNLMRSKPFFYLSINNTNPSWWDAVELKWKDGYPYIWAISIAAYVTFQFFV